MNESIVVEELTLIPIGKESQQIGIKPIRVMVGGRPLSLYFDARDIAAIKRVCNRRKRLKAKSDEAD